jgi:hypothetical protein
MSNQIYSPEFLKLPNPEQSCMKLRPKKIEQPYRGAAYFSAVVTKLDGTQKLVSDFEHNVIPSVFVDKLHKMGLTDTVASERGFGCIALTADTGQTLNAAVTALTGEITTNGLQRVDAVTKTHSVGTNSTLIEHTFTLSGTQSDITRTALFNIATAPVSGTIGPVAAFTNGATSQMVSGETLKVSITVTTS